MTNEEQTELIKIESKRLWKKRGFKWLVLAFIILLGIVIFNSARYQVHLVICKANVEYGIGSAISVYMNDYDDKLPLPAAWNDLLIEYSDVSKSVFHCPGSKSEGKMSDYSINKYQYELGLGMGDLVGLFESEPGWNQIGDVEIFSYLNHEGKGGCCNENSFYGVQFVEPDEVDGLSWKPKE